MTLTQYLQEIWGVQEANFDVDGTTLYVEQVCIVTTTGTWSCLPQRTESLSIPLVVGSTVGGAVLGSICILGLIAVMVVIYKKHGNSSERLTLHNIALINFCLF